MHLPAEFQLDGEAGLILIEQSAREALKHEVRSGPLEAFVRAEADFSL